MCRYELLGVIILIIHRIGDSLKARKASNKCVTRS